MMSESVQNVSKLSIKTVNYYDEVRQTLRSAGVFGTPGYGPGDWGHGRCHQVQNSLSNRSGTLSILLIACIVPCVYYPCGGICIFMSSFCFNDLVYDTMCSGGKILEQHADSWHCAIPLCSYYELEAMEYAR